MKKIKILHSWFYTAGEQYKWTWAGYDVKGVGIEMGILKKYPELQITIDNEVYTLSSTDALAFILTYRSIYDAKGTKLGIVSKSLLNRRITQPPAVLKKPKDKTLF